MGKRIYIETKPEILRALREMLGFTIEDVAKKLEINSEKIKQVEEGTILLTLSQIKKLADIYRISLAAFFSDSIPKMPVIADYRLNREKRLKPQVFLAQKRAYYLSKEIAALSDKKSEIPSFGPDINPIELARAFRKYLSIEVIKDKVSKEVLKEYKSAIEEKMFIPIIECPLKAEDVRAFSMLSDIAMIVLNEDDKPEVKLFSLFHEVGHLLRKNAGLCSIDIELENENREIETYCNQFSAEFLVPGDDLRLEIENRSLPLFSYETVSELAQMYGVSKQVMMLRLLWLGFINRRKYDQFKSQWIEPKEKGKFGRKNWEEVFFNRASGLVIREIKEAYKRGDITSADVITTLGMRTKYVEKFIENEGL